VKFFGGRSLIAENWATGNQTLLLWGLTGTPTLKLIQIFICVSHTSSHSTTCSLPLILPRLPYHYSSRFYSSLNDICRGIFNINAVSSPPLRGQPIHPTKRQLHSIQARTYPADWPPTLHHLRPSVCTHEETRKPQSGL